ncbi:MAG: hypothetical protein MK085_02200 [Phycisphaerales bacterium]|nr:hypothetical protein [Phycisphaerales bacterium]
MMDDTSNTNPTTRRLEDPVPCTPLTRAQQVAARGEAGVIGLFLGLLVFVLLLILGITGEKPMFILSGGVSGGLIGIGLGLLGIREGRRCDLPRHTKMGRWSLGVGVVTVCLGLLTLLP